MIADPQTIHPLIRRLSEDDLDAVMEIEVANYPFPWTRGIFSDCIRVDYDCWGLQLESRLIGYCVLTQAAGESHLLNLCVARPWQRQGFGGTLLEHALRIARNYRCNSMFLEVRPSNPAGISLYKKRGFEVVGERPDYYTSHHGRENAIIMRFDLLHS
jgi:ribosomal-protein-alanine N-acetyltransferase